jgi:phage shock protein C
MKMNNSYALDKGNAMLLGVCAGLARTTGLDRTLVRFGAVAATLFLLGPVAILLYIVTAWVARDR